MYKVLRNLLQHTIEFRRSDLCKLLKNHNRKISSSQSTIFTLVKILVKYCQKFYKNKKLTVIIQKNIERINLHQYCIKYAVY